MKLSVAGREVFAATGGRPFDSARPSVIFIHGAGADHTVWALQTRYFAHHGRSVLALDLPGHGRSAGPSLDSIGALAEWLGGVLEAAGLGAAALVGHSMGALVALNATARLGAKIKTLALLGASLRMPVHPDLLAAAAKNDRLAFDLVTSWSHGPCGRLGGNRAPGLWLMGGADRLLERAAPGVLHGDLAACHGYADAAQAAAKVDCPSLVIIGAVDRMAPAAAGRALAEAIPKARVTEIPACGHMMMLEKPDETLDALNTIV